ncbi:MAG: MBL fold metallo-hydrolase [Flavobacteriaceae bacterium]|nr:MBL fold metallo-hydrolase [Flavobacteriaceae bacterium]
MKLYPIESQNFKLDGGAMFGVVPKSLWQKTNPADANNMIDIAARCLLIEDGKRLILVDTGLGNKQTDKFFGYYHLWGDYQLEASLKQHGFHPDDITDVFLTHLHFDHCGGAVSKNPQSGVLRPSFKNAIYWSNANHWQWATQPNAREKASFLPENILPIQESGQLQMISPDKTHFLTHVPDINLSVFFADGHTEKQMIPIVTYQNKKIAFMADLLPTTGHIPLPYVMGYDTRPLLTLAEKEIFLNYAADQELFLFLEHDAHHQMITVTHTDKGVRLDKTYTCEEIL